VAEEFEHSCKFVGEQIWWGSTGFALPPSVQLI